MGTSTTDLNEARKYCMNFGMRVAVLWIAAFLCSMYGYKIPLLGPLSPLFVLFSAFYAGRLIQGFNQTIDSPRFLRTWWMAMLVFFYAGLCSTLAEFIYFQYIDNGALASQFSQIMNMPEYKPVLDAFGKEVLDQVLSLYSKPLELTKGAFMFNILLGLALSLPTALIGSVNRSKR